MAVSYPARASAPAATFAPRQHLAVCCLWFAFNAQWSSLLPIVLPAQIATIAPDDKFLLSGIVIPIGALVALVVTPLAGALSDRSNHSRGRRRPYIIAGTILNAASLMLLSTFGPGSSPLAFAAAFAALNFGANWWGGPYAGLIPDVVPPDQQGRASGYMAAMMGLGTLVGAASAGPLIVWGGFPAAYGLLAGLVIICAIITLVAVPEKQAAPHEPFAWREFIRSFWVPPQKHRDFYIVLLTRSAITMGMFFSVNYFLYFLEHVIKLENPIQNGSLLLGAVILVSMPGCLLAGAWADRHGPKRIVIASGWTMAITTLIYTVICFFPNWPITIVLAVVHGVANAAYQTVDWALALRVLPNPDTPAKDMGIWHISMVAPQMVAPAVTGVVLTMTQDTSLTVGYAVIFLLTGLFYIAGTIPIRWIRSVQ